MKSLQEHIIESINNSIKEASEGYTPEMLTMV